MSYKSQFKLIDDQEGHTKAVCQKCGNLLEFNEMYTHHCNPPKHDKSIQWTH
jgi:uncharacterized C2H2 Zn-finger protein